MKLVMSTGRGQSYFLFLKTMFKTKQVTANPIPNIANMSNITITETCIELKRFIIEPSGGIPSAH